MLYGDYGIIIRWQQYFLYQILLKFIKEIQNFVSPYNLYDKSSD